MKRVILSIVLVVFMMLNSYYSQEENNLILNPSFESMDGKLKKLKQINIAKEWDSPTALKADLYSTEKKLPVSAPVNQHGKEHPMDGENYAGITMYSYNNKSPRTYIQTQLSSPLTSGLEYCIKFNVSLGDLSKYAVNNLGMYLAKDPLFLEGKGDIIFQKDKDFEHVVRDTENKIYNARYNWTPVCAIYTARGKESFITIGNFFNNKDTKYEKLKKIDGFPGTQEPIAYYYIDNVEVSLIEDMANCDCHNKLEKANEESIIYHRDFMKEEGEYTPEELISLETVYFDVQRSNIDDMFIDELNSIVNILTKNPNINIELHGHTDKMETAAIKKDPENQKLINLGLERAGKVKSYLVKKGIDGNRILTINHDSSQPAHNSFSELSLAKNRRVVFKIAK
jgi:outer membrane protein OmpA-like peptidoglycan-associated protein